MKCGGMIATALPPLLHHFITNRSHRSAPPAQGTDGNLVPFFPARRERPNSKGMAMLICLFLLLFGRLIESRTPSPSPTSHPSPTPRPLKGARCNGNQSYAIRATYNWEPDNYFAAEPGKGFTPLICVAHSDEYHLWSEDAFLRQQLIQVIREYNLSYIESSLLDIINGNKTVASYNKSYLDPIVESPGGRDKVTNITVSGDLNATFISCFAAFVPSPDWFIGIDSYEMCELNETSGSFSWRTEDLDFGMIPYDGGLDASNQIQFEAIPEDPPKIVQQKIEFLTDVGYFNISNMNETVRTSRNALGSSRPVDCFPANALAHLSDGTRKRMDELKIDDMLENASGTTASPVYMFSHRHADIMTEFVRLHYSSNRTFTASRGHFIFVNDGELKAMDGVKVGDALELVSEGKKSLVTRISRVWERGLYNPHTLSGELVVNDVRVSIYTRALNPATARSVLSIARALHSWKYGRWWNEWLTKRLDDGRLNNRLASFMDFTTP